MKSVTVMFDSLAPRFLSAYGCDWTHTPNFARLARHTATFDNSFVCSMPCIPARRDFHTGRPNFLHRSWGPLEPFDDSMPEMLKQAGVYTHLSSDHCHYWEDGGGTYHGRFNSWEFFRGQEGDPYIPDIAGLRAHSGGNTTSTPFPAHDKVNRQAIHSEADFSQAKTFRGGLDFLDRNHAEDQWMLQIECFDPHPPFLADGKYRDLYPRGGSDMDGFDWPPYGAAKQSQEEIEAVRRNYASLISMCDARLGEVLDAFDRHNLWDDTMLVVWADHGFMLGEHDAWGMCWLPYYDDAARNPLFIHDPRNPTPGARRQAIVQPSIDLAPTLLDYFDLKPTADMTGRPLGETVAEDAAVRSAAMFGIFGGHVSVTDSRYTYFRGSVRDDNQPMAQYTLMPTHMRRRFDVESLQQATLAPAFSFTKGCPVLRMPCDRAPIATSQSLHENLLFDRVADPGQTRPIKDPDLEARMVQTLRELMHAADAPAEQYDRLGLS